MIFPVELHIPFLLHAHEAYLGFVKLDRHDLYDVSDRIFSQVVKELLISTLYALRPFVFDLRPKLQRRMSGLHNELALIVRLARRFYLFVIAGQSHEKTDLGVDVRNGATLSMPHLFELFRTPSDALLEEVMGLGD